MQDDQRFANDQTGEMLAGQNRKAHSGDNDEKNQPSDPNDQREQHQKAEKRHGQHYAAMIE